MHTKTIDYLDLTSGERRKAPVGALVRELSIDDEDESRSSMWSITPEEAESRQPIKIESVDPNEMFWLFDPDMGLWMLSVRAASYSMRAQGGAPVSLSAQDDAGAWAEAESFVLSQQWGPAGGQVEVHVYRDEMDLGSSKININSNADRIYMRNPTGRSWAKASDIAHELAAEMQQDYEQVRALLDPARGIDAAAAERARKAAHGIAKHASAEAKRLTAELWKALPSPASDQELSDREAEARAAIRTVDARNMLELSHWAKSMPYVRKTFGFAGPPAPEVMVNSIAMRLEEMRDAAQRAWLSCVE